jgi:hypothetical protein
MEQERSSMVYLIKEVADIQIHYIAISGASVLQDGFLRSMGAPPRTKAIAPFKE